MRLFRFLRTLASRIRDRVRIEILLKPVRVRVDASTVCQLRCPICEEKGFRTRAGVGNLQLEHLTALIHDNPQIRSIELSNGGELFMNPGLLDIIRFAHEHKIRLTAYNGVNFNTVSDEVLEAVVTCPFEAMTISIDGASPETYRIYRQGGDFDTVIRNIRKLNGFKRQHGSEFPKLIWKFILFGHNQHEIEDARKMAGELQMEFRTDFNVFPERFPVTDTQRVRQAAGFGSQEEENLMTRSTNNVDVCLQLWEEPQINFDGKLLGCCCNNTRDYGNVFVEGLSRCLRGERFVYAKKMLMGLVPPRKDIYCSSCEVYLWRKRNGSFLKRYTLPEQVRRLAGFVAGRIRVFFGTDKKR